MSLVSANKTKMYTTKKSMNSSEEDNLSLDKKPRTKKSLGRSFNVDKLMRNTESRSKKVPEKISLRNQIKS